VQMTCTGDGVLAAITSGKSLQFTVTRKVFTAKTKSSPLHCFQILDTTPSYMKEWCLLFSLYVSWQSRIGSIYK